MDNKEFLEDVIDEDNAAEVEESNLDEDIGTVGDDGEDAEEDADSFESFGEDDEDSDTEDLTDDEQEDDEDDEGEESTPTEERADSELEEAAKKLLISLGAKPGDDPVKSLKKLTAESMGITLEEYERRESAAREKQAKWDEQAEKDIEAIHEAFPASKKYASLKDLPNKAKFAKLMDDPELKLSAVEAFAASHTDIVKAHSRAPGKRSDLGGTKDHIKSSVPKGAKDTSTVIPKSEMETYREMFPDLSKEEIKKLYKNANK